jgi:hypothetical protein
MLAASFRLLRNPRPGLHEMLRRSSNLLAATFVALATLFCFSAEVHAQRALQQVLDLNRQGMEAYNNLEIEQSQGLLNQALEAAQRGPVTGSPLARTYMNLGIVAIGGLGDNGAGLQYFTQAIQADRNVALDPLTSTPDIQVVFTMAQQRARSGGATTAEPEPTPEPEPSAGGSDLPHTPVTEQLQQTALPVFVEVPNNPAHVYLYYRATGMREFRRVEMERVGRGYGLEVPCSEVFAGTVAYYIVAFARDGSPLGFAGSQSAPIEVNIVTSRTTAAPALPGRAPPEQCAEEECPPGMPCANASNPTSRRGMGESCSSDSECNSGNCEDDLCAAGSGSSSSGSQGIDEPNQSSGPAFFARVAGTAGLSFIGTNSAITVDRVPCAIASESDADTCLDNSLYPGLVANDPSTWQQFGYELCDPEDPGSAACFYVKNGGVVANGGLRIDLGYYLADFFAITLGARIQPNSGQGTLSLALLNLGVEFQLTPPVDTGFHVHAHLRFNVGQTQVFLSRGPNSENAPWGTTGLFGFDVGVTAGYRFMRNFGLFLQPTAILLFSNRVAFTLDISGGLEVSF